MNKTVVIGLVAVILIALGVYLFSSNSAEAPIDSTPQATSTNTGTKTLPEGMDDGTVTGEQTFDALVSFTGSAFNPQVTTIKKGQTVRFINNGTTDVWPASAVHPTHSAYPEKTASDCLGSAFDACRGLKPGESWDFTFNDVGTWGFHDHLHSRITGQIVVTQ